MGKTTQLLCWVVGKRGCLLYDTVIPRPKWALDPDSTAWPMASTSFYLRPQPEPRKATILGFILPKSLRSSNLNSHAPCSTARALLDEPHPEQEERRSRTPFLECLIVPLGISLPSISTEVRTISKVTLTTLHSHLNTHLQLTTLDLLLY